MTYSEIEATVKEVLAKQLTMEAGQDQSGFTFG